MIRYASLLPLIALLGALGSAHGSYCSQPGWDIVWQDEFDGDTLNASNWNIMVGHDEGTLRAALGTKEDVYLEDGKLVLRTRYDAGVYKSGAIVSGGHHGGSSIPVGNADQSWMYGRFCVSAKLPGVEPTSSPRPDNCSTLMQDTDVLGAGGVATLSANDEGECCDLCKGNSLCSYFVYMKGAWGCNVGCCYLKDAGATGFNTSAPGRIAGFVPGANDKNQGIWPAHWLMPDVDDCWPKKGEIDVLEMVNGDGQSHGTYHYSGDGSCGSDAGNGGVTANLQTWASEFHEYAVEWTADHMQFVVDGEVKYTVLPGSRPSYGGPNPTAFYAEKYYWLLNTAVGHDGAWAGPPGPNTVFPAYHHIDYVRVAKKTQQKHVDTEDVVV